MHHLSIRASLLMAFGAMLALILGISVLSFQAQGVSRAALNDLVRVNLAQANHANRADVNVAEMRAHIVRFGEFARQGQDAAAAREIALAGEAMERAEARMEAFRGITLGPSAERARLVDEVNAAYSELVSPGFKAAVLSGELEGIFAYRQQVTEAGDRFAGIMREFMSFSESRADMGYAGAAAAGERMQWISIALLVLALLVSGLVVLLISRRVVAPLREAVGHCERIAEGDLTGTIDHRSRNEIGQLLAALGGMQDRLRGIVTTLHASSDSVATGATHIAEGSQDLASRTEEQASALQETASSMEQIASTVRQNTDTASQANEISRTAAERAEVGIKEVEASVALMQGMEESSRQIAEIIGVIDGIAFQTNILALNASVEAARAGEHGRGFAVVASEVRTLASRTADSSRQIRTMIEEVTQRISEGSQQAGRSGEKIRGVVESVRQVAAMIDELSLAAQEQQAGVEQVGTAVSQMDAVTQQNASLVEQTSTAAANLNDEAHRLTEVVGTFKIDAGQAARSSAAPFAPAAAAARASAPAAPGADRPSLQAPTPSSRAPAQRQAQSEPEWEEF